MVMVEDVYVDVVIACADFLHFFPPSSQDVVYYILFFAICVVVVAINFS